MPENKLQATTIPVSEGSTFTSGEEDTTMALGEEGPTSPSSEDSSVFQANLEGRHGGPFGAY
ncbi:MAG TPA: hypothetical protein VKL99_12365 [Candidatus Angelobacter sp.]|nr:hypothetical protein [Candidatus Angelobacter sp.]